MRTVARLKELLRYATVLVVGGTVLVSLVNFGAMWVAGAGRTDLAVRYNLYEGDSDQSLSFSVYCIETSSGEFDRLVYPGNEGLLEDERLQRAMRSGRTDWTFFAAVRGGLPFRSISFAYNTLAEVGGSASSICEFQGLVFYRLLWWGAIADVFVFGGAILALYLVAVKARAVMRSWRADGSPQCSCCGYNLTGLTSDRCPECGSRKTDQ